MSEIKNRSHNRRVDLAKKREDEEDKWDIYHKNIMAEEQEKRDAKAREKAHVRFHRVFHEFSLNFYKSRRLLVFQ